MGTRVEGSRPMAYVLGHQCGASLTKVGGQTHLCGQCPGVALGGRPLLPSGLGIWAGQIILWTSVTTFYKTGRPQPETLRPISFQASIQPEDLSDSFESDMG